MSHRRRLAVLLSITLTSCIAAVPAHAQYTGMRDPATGETYNVEVAAGLWRPALTAVISSESLGIAGTPIDLIGDLGFTDKKVYDLRGVLRIARKHKLRVSYLPFSYAAAATLKRTVVFNGIKYNVGIPVNTTLEFDAWRFGYEYDFIYTDRGFLGLILEGKYNNVTATLTSPLNNEFATAKGVVPGVGLIARVYPFPNGSITAELTGMKAPKDAKWLDGNHGQYWDLDVYGTLNLTDHFGAQGGYRRLSLNYQVKQDTGDLTLSGVYVMGVVRF